MGHISGAYAARVSRDLSVCSRFDFNVYSYESEWTMGAEWWLRRSLAKATPELLKDGFLPSILPSLSPVTATERIGEVHGVVKARASTNNVIYV